MIILVISVFNSFLVFLKYYFFSLFAWLSMTDTLSWLPPLPHSDPCPYNNALPLGAGGDLCLSSNQQYMAKGLWWDVTLMVSLHFIRLHLGWFSNSTLPWGPWRSKQPWRRTHYEVLQKASRTSEWLAANSQE